MKEPEVERWNRKQERTELLAPFVTDTMAFLNIRKYLSEVYSYRQSRPIATVWDHAYAIMHVLRANTNKGR